MSSTEEKMPLTESGEKNKSKFVNEKEIANTMLSSEEKIPQTGCSEKDQSKFSNHKGMSEDLSIRVSTQESSPCCARIFPYGFKAEFKELFQLAWPMVLTQLFQMLLGPVALIFCGHLGKIELDAVALANSMLNVTGISIAVGLSSACDTLFSQMYGSVNWHKLGIVVQRSILILLLAVFPCWAIHLNTDSLLNLIGQDPAVTKLTGEYMIILMPGTLSFFLYISLSKYIQNQNVVLPNVIIGIISNLINALLHYVFIYVFEMGTAGSAISQSVSYFAMFLLTLIYIRVSGVYRGTWSGWDMECLQEWGVFFKLALAGLGMICIEWWAFEIGVFLTGILGATELGAQSVIFQLEAIAYQLPLGVGIAASIRVGQYLGSANGHGALTATRVALSVIVVSGLIVGIIFITLSEYLPGIFTNVTEVKDLATELLPILGAYMVFDSIAGVCAGILRGCGRQTVGAVIIFFGYATALSAGIPLMFLTTLKIAGLWIALAVALFLESIVFFLMVNFTNWDNQIEKAQDRTHAEQAFQGNYKPGDEDEPDETTGLLSSRSRPGSVCYEQVDPLLDRGSGSNSYRRRYSSHLIDPFPAYVPPEGHLGVGKLVLTRLAALAVVLVVFGLGIVLHFLFRPSEEVTPLCIPSESPYIDNSTLPICNITAVTMSQAVTVPQQLL